MSENNLTEQFVFEQNQKEFFQKKEHLENLWKWGMKDTFQVQSFRFNLSFQEMHVKSFLKDLLNDKTIRINMPILGLSGNIDSFSYSQQKCSQSNMSLFDKLEEQGTYDDYFEDVHIQSLLKEMLLKEESEYYEVYNDEDRKQLLFAIFYHLAIGGQISQVEDTIDQYLDLTKNLYKNLVCAKKDQNSQQIFIDSYVYKINKIDVKINYKQGVYPIKEHPQNGFYVIINPSLRIVNILFNKWQKVW